jgi:hypothetical protein
MVQINDLDLSLFQFDFELTWAVFMMNADRTLYGRYGTRSYKDRKRNVFFDRSRANVRIDGVPLDMSVTGFMDTLREALAIHRRHEADTTGRLRRSLKPKAGNPWPWKTPRDMPGIRRSCTHCHQVNSNLILHHRAKRRKLPDSLLWSFPMPDLLGMVLDSERAATVERIVKGSEAADAGIEVGDRIVSMAGQPMLSPADVQWVLHHAVDGAPLKIRVQRPGKPRPRNIDLSLSLPRGWRRRGTFSWRWRSLREAFARILDGEAWHCENLTAAQRASRGVRDGELGVLVLANARRNTKRLLKDDVIVGVDEKDSLATASEFLAYILREKAPGSRLELSVLRRGKRIRVVVPVVR